MALAVRYGAHELGATAPAVGGGRFRGEVPVEGKLPAGVYTARLTFELQKQSRIATRAWLPTLSAEDQERLTLFVRQEQLEVGSGADGRPTPEERERQRVELAARATRLADGLEALVSELTRAYASALRCFWKRAGQAGFDEAGWLAYLRQQGVASTDAEVAELKRDQRFAAASGYFKAPEWEAWLATLLVRLQQVAAEEARARAEWACPLDPAVDALADEALAGAVGLLQGWSRTLYQRSKLPVPAVVSQATGDALPVPSGEPSLTGFRRTRDRLLQRAGAR